MYAMSKFRNKRDGFYVNVGAYHPHLYSVTYALYKKAGAALQLIQIRLQKYSFVYFVLATHLYVPVSAMECVSISSLMMGHIAVS